MSAMKSALPQEDCSRKPDSKHNKDYHRSEKKKILERTVASSSILTCHYANTFKRAFGKTTNLQAKITLPMC
jgi:hypothetical protein